MRFGIKVEGEFRDELEKLLLKGGKQTDKIDFAFAEHGQVYVVIERGRGLTTYRRTETPELKVIEREELFRLYEGPKVFLAQFVDGPSYEIARQTMTRDDARKDKTIDGLLERIEDHVKVGRVTVTDFGGQAAGTKTLTVTGIIPKGTGYFDRTYVFGTKVDYVKEYGPFLPDCPTF